MRSKNKIDQALAYIKEKKKGYLSDLLNKFDDDILESLELMSVIRRGQEISGKDSWAITKKAEKFTYRKYPTDDLSLIGKLFNWFDHMFIGKAVYGQICNKHMIKTF